jgi:NAD+ kinase
VAIERIWIFEGKTGKRFPKEKELLIQELKKAFKLDSKLSSKTSLAISLAGDGSLLSMIRNMGEKRFDVPVLGVHTSEGLGFLHRLALPAKAAQSSQAFKVWIKNFVEMLKSESFQLQKRWGVEASLNRHQLCWGMNDLVMSKGALSRMVCLKVKVDGSLLFAKLRGDGLIIASPTGSTAYSLAAGGPIVVPGLDGILITPILPHEIAQRPLVISSNSSIQIEVLEGPPCYLTEDGQRTTEIKSGQSFVIQKSSKPICWLEPEMEGVRDYFELLRTKLGLGGEKGARIDKS